MMLAVNVWAQSDESRRKGVLTPKTEQQKPSAAAGGIVRGTVTDQASGEKMMEATVSLLELQKGAFSDLDGAYAIANVPPGIYTLRISYVSYQSQTIEKVEVKAGQVTVINAYLVEENVTTETVVIEAKALKSTESSVLSLQRLSSVTLDGISSQQVSRNGDSDAAAALVRVTGLTVEGGRYVYVRGLGDRYNKTTVNGAEIPGLDPTRNSVQMDMFPSNLIDNVVVYKAFSPDLPGSYTGGLIDITTKDFPEKFTLHLGTSFGYNTQTTFNKDFLLYDRSRTDWMGFDDGSRLEPSSLRGETYLLPPAPASYNSENANAVANDRIAKEFGSDMFPTTQRNFLDQNHNLSIGNQIKLFGRPLGFIASLTYRRQYQYYDNGRQGAWKASGRNASLMNADFDYNDERGEDAVLFGSLFTVSYRLTPSNKLSASFMHNHSGEASARYLVGFAPVDAGDQTRESRVMQYLDRSLDVGQLRGEHVVKSLMNLKIDWVASLVYMRQSEPDLRLFTNQYDENPDGTRSYAINTSQYDPPTRFFRTLDENSSDVKAHLTLPVNEKLKLKTGFSFTNKFRVPFREKWFQYNEGLASRDYNGDPAEYFGPDNLGADEASGNWKLYIRDWSKLKNSYDGTERVVGGYFMGDYDVSKWLRVVGGARVETTFMEVISKDKSLPIGQIETDDILPALNLIFKPAEKINFRANYGRTVARPIMREMAPYENFDFIGSYFVIGNPNLDRTLIDNFDVRLEWFPSNLEVLSVSVFYKAFQNPIERAIDTRFNSTSVQLQFRNVDAATAYGAEIEIRKNLDFVWDRLKNFQFGMNYSWIRSMVDISELELLTRREFDPGAKDTRPMYGQSPFVINSALTYVNTPTRTSATINFNIFGERISEVGVGSRPDVYEQPRPDLGLNIQQGVGENWIFRFGLQNLLNPKYQHVQRFKNDERVFREYTIGTRIVFGVAYQIK